MYKAPVPSQGCQHSRAPGRQHCGKLLLTPALVPMGSKTKTEKENRDKRVRWTGTEALSRLTKFTVSGEAGRPRERRQVTPALPAGEGKEEPRCLVSEGDSQFL